MQLQIQTHVVDRIGPVVTRRPSIHYNSLRKENQAVEKTASQWKGIRTPGKIGKEG